ncbi:hypothetical protein ACFWY5_54905 [Nonomuraea sp. NPDC059007]|uniref:hypothetical protein n=1 Tax=Nonomuraea sp. NPDC059007 TaxID=3346692 RepID=UPI00369359C5
MSGQERVGAILEHPRVQRAIIVLNAITIGCETSPYLVERVGGVLYAIDRGVLVIFTAEIAARLYAYRRSFFTDP